MGDIGRHEEVVSTCLDQFVKKGLCVQSIQINLERRLLLRSRLF